MRQGEPALRFCSEHVQLVDPQLNQVLKKRLIGFARTLEADELKPKTTNFKEPAARAKRAPEAKQAASKEVKDETE